MTTMTTNAAAPISDDLAALRRGVVEARLRRRGRGKGGPRRLLPPAPRPRTGRTPSPRTHSAATTSTASSAATRAVADGVVADGVLRGQKANRRSSSKAGGKAGGRFGQGRAGTIRDVAATLWTRDEETRLVQELRDGLTVDDIATAHQRTTLAILARASRMTPDELPGQDTRQGAGEGTRALTRAQRTEWLREQLHTNPAYDWAAHLGETRRRRYAEVRSLAPRTGAIWTADEDAQVLAALEAGVPNVELAAQLQRSAKSTARRAWRLTQTGEEVAAGAAGDVDGRPAPEEAPPAPKSPAPKSLIPSTPPRSPRADPASSSPGAEEGGGLSAHGQPWSEDETFQLLEELRQGLSTDDVAAAHQRSVRAINGRAATVLTHLTGSKHALAQDSAEQLRTRLTHTTTTAGEHDADRAAIAVLHELLGATQVDA